MVETSPYAEVYLDDERQGQTSQAGRLVIGNVKPGDHTLRVTLAGKKDAEAQVTATVARDTKVEVNLLDLPGTIVIQSSPGAEVFLDDTHRGITDSGGDLTVREVPGGLQALRVTARGKRDFVGQLTVEPGKESAVKAMLTELEQPPPPQPALETSARAAGPPVQPSRLLLLNGCGATFPYLFEVV